MSCQGCSNFETFCVINEAENDKGRYDAHRLAASIAWEEAVSTEILTRSQNARFRFSDDLLANAKLKAEELDLPSPFGSLLSSAIDGVNWDEVADHWLKSIAEYEPKKYWYED